MSTTRNSIDRRIGQRILALAFTALAFTGALAGCVGGQPTNRSLNSIHQPVVERTSYTLDINTLPGGGVPVSEQRRLAGWFDRWAWAMATRWRWTTRPLIPPRARPCRPCFRPTA
jgi:pilus assembly protein CpaD